MPQPTERADYWQDLIIAILAVNQYSLEKTYPLVGSLEKVGLLDPSILANLEYTQIAVCLREGGCDRGEFMTTLFAKRLAALGELVRTQGLSVCERVLASSDSESIERFLIAVYGIGPKVIQNFLFLRGLRSQP